MKATRKLIPAIAMLLISAVMMSTATFAWFSTNSQVEATGLKITAVAKNTFLTISTSATEIVKPDYQKIEIDFDEDTDATELYPITYFTAESGAGKKGVSGAGWYTAVAAATNASAANSDGYKAHTPDENGDITGYVVHKRIYVSIAKNFVDATNLKIDTVDKTDSAATVVVMSDKAVNGEVAIVSGDNTTSNVTLATDVKNGEYVTLDLYFFIDGEHGDVKTENAINLKDFQLTISFKVDASAG